MLENCIVVGLATFGVAYIIRYTEGPFDIFSKFRRLVKLELPVCEEDTVEIVDYIEALEPDFFFGKLMACFWCLSTWIGFGLTLLFVLLFGEWKSFLFIWLSTIGISGLLHDIVD